MKALIKSASWVKEYENKFGKLHLHKITFEENGEQKSGYYSAKLKEQDKFIAGKEAEFTIETQTGKNGTWFKIKPVVQNKGYSNAGRAMQREQTKYSGFAMSYAKDLLIAGKLESIEAMYAEAQNMFDTMVEMDKTLLS